MYNLQLIEERIMSIASQLGLSKNKLLSNANLNKSVFDNMKKGQIPSVDKIHAIADYLGCSVDYLLGRTDLKSTFPKMNLISTPVKVNMSKLFNPDIPLNKYISRLWEAQNNIFTVGVLFDNILNHRAFENNDWFYIFEYNIVLLYGAAELLTLEVKNKKAKGYKEALDELKNNPNYKIAYNEFYEFFLKNKEFFRRSRNMVAHFEHYKDEQTYSDYISSQHEYELCFKGNFLTDYDNPVYLNILIALYREENQSSASNSDEKVIEEIVNMFTTLMEKISNVLDTILSSYYIENFENEQGGDA